MPASSAGLQGVVCIAKQVHHCVQCLAQHVSSLSASSRACTKDVLLKLRRHAFLQSKEEEEGEGYTAGRSLRVRAREDHMSGWELWKSSWLLLHEAPIDIHNSRLESRNRHTLLSDRQYACSRKGCGSGAARYSGVRFEQRGSRAPRLLRRLLRRYDATDVPDFPWMTPHKKCPCCTGMSAPALPLCPCLRKGLNMAKPLRLHGVSQPHISTWEARVCLAPYFAGQTRVRPSETLPGYAVVYLHKRPAHAI